MSHFTVTAIINEKNTDLETMMAPFNEQDRVFFTAHDTTADFLREYEEHKNRPDFLAEYPNGTIKDFLMWWNGKISVIEGSRDHRVAENEKEGHAVFSKDGELLKVVGYWNDNAKYDYYTEGGRWGVNHGFIFKDKNFDPTENGVRIKDLDIDAMVARVEADARADYKEVIEFIGHIPHLDLTWDEVCEIGENWNDPLRKEAEEKYHAQDDCVAYANYKNQKNLFWGTITEYCCTEEEYVANSSLPYYSIVDENGWHSKGEMGWFGCSTDAMTEAEWKQMQIEIFKNADPDALVVMLDCHI